MSIPSTLPSPPPRPSGPDPSSVPTRAQASDPAAWPAPDQVDVRLVVADMDGTLLDGDKRLPDGLWPLLDAMEARGITFAPASGRQYATLRRMFDRVAVGMTVIAENGAVVMRDDTELYTAPLDLPTVLDAIRRTRAAPLSTGLDRVGETSLAGGGPIGQRGPRGDGGLVVACARTALVERNDPPFLEAAHPYYNDLTVVPDLVAALTGPDAAARGWTPVKLALFDFDDVTGPAEDVLGRFRDTHEVVISGRQWADLMRRGVDKADAVRALQASLGVTAEQTVAFGDYLNDWGMLQASGLSFAMANGHPDLRAAARYVAPANTEGGVLTVMRALLGTGTGTDAGK